MEYLPQNFILIACRCYKLVVLLYKEIQYNITKENILKDLCVCVHICMCIMFLQCLRRSEESIRSSLEQELQMVLARN